MDKFIYTHLTKLALGFSFDAHKKQRDKSGLPYVFHPFYLATKMDDEYSICVALLHDVFEDSTDLKLIEMIRSSFPKEIVDALDLLNHNKKDDYLKDYIPKIKTNKLATKVKIADLNHNSQLDRLPEINWKSILRLAKYNKALLLLKNKKIDKLTYLVEFIEDHKPDQPKVDCSFNVEDKFKFLIDETKSDKWEEFLNDIAKKYSNLLLKKVKEYDVNHSDGGDSLGLKFCCNDYNITLEDN